VDSKQYVAGYYLNLNDNLIKDREFDPHRNAI
jgi:hypothetical protein